MTVKSSDYQIRNQNHQARVEVSTSEGIPDSIWKIIWSAEIPQKIKVFLWKVMNNCLPVGENLWKRKITQSPIYPFCRTEPETVEHTFLFCDWTRLVWLGVQIQCIPRREEVRSIHQWILKKVEEFKGLADFTKFAMISLFCAIWSIWKGKNEAFYAKIDPNPWSVINRANILANDYYHHAVKRTQRVIPWSHQITVSKGWRPPLPGVLKINVDAAFNKDKNIAYAGVIV